MRIRVGVAGLLLVLGAAGLTLAQRGGGDDWVVKSNDWGGTPGIVVMESAPPQFAIELSGTFYSTGRMAVDKVHVDHGEKSIRVEMTANLGPGRAVVGWKQSVSLGHLDRGDYAIEIWARERRGEDEGEYVRKRVLFVTATGEGADADDKRAWNLALKRGWLQDRKIVTEDDKSFLELEFMVPSGGWALTVDKVHDADRHARVRVDVTLTRLEGAASQRPVKKTFRVPLADLGRDDHCVEFWKRDSADGTYVFADVAIVGKQE